MLKDVAFVIGVLIVLNGLMVHFFRGPTVKLTNKMVQEVVKHKKYKLINFFVILDVILGMLLIWIAYAYS